MQILNINKTGKEKFTFFYRVFKIARTWGFIKILLFIPYEIFYGIKYNVNTLFSLNNQELDVSKERKVNSTEYFPTPYYIANKVFKLVRNKLAGSVFIDFGSGAGRILMFVTQFGPKKIIGVEFSKKLCDKAISNLNKYFNTMNNTYTDWEIKHCDALEYDFPLDSNVFFFYDPFGPIIIQQIIQKIKLSLEQNNREIIIIYISPIHRKIFSEMGFELIHSKVNKYNKGFVIFKN